jgi:hypothetical protein
MLAIMSMVWIKTSMITASNARAQFTGLGGSVHVPSKQGKAGER